MAELVLTVRRGFCNLNREEFEDQCLSQFGKDVGCRCYNDGLKKGDRYIPYGNCINADYEYIYKGISAKNFEVEVVRFELDEWAEVTVGRKTYECTSVILNGKTIYPTPDTRRELMNG